MALRADTRHLWTNVVQALAVILALGLVALTGRTVFDPVFALLLAAYLLWIAGHVLFDALSEIMDVRLPEEEERLIEQCLEALRPTGVQGYHALRTRKSGRQRYVDVHLAIDPEQSIADTTCASDWRRRSARACPAPWCRSTSSRRTTRPAS
jgi:cation diffusion facilitator family transporter